MECELCGGKEARHRLKVEGTYMRVCEGCAKHGQVLKERRIPKSKPRGYTAPRTEFAVRPDFGRVVKRKREEMGIKQEHLARMLKEKESIVQQIENGQLRPGIALARKLERRLDITLLEEMEELKGVEKKGTSKGGGLTIGDLLKR